MGSFLDPHVGPAGRDDLAFGDGQRNDLAVVVVGPTVL